MLGFLMNVQNPPETSRPGLSGAGKAMAESGCMGRATGLDWLWAMTGALWWWSGTEGFKAPTASRPVQQPLT
jgi:hypothetical protein